MRNAARWAIVCFALTAGISFSNAARGGPKEEAQRHFEAGKSLMELEDYSSAAVEFELSVSLFATKNGLFNLANCYKALHRYDASIWAFTRLEKDFGKQMDAKMLDAVEKTKLQLLSVVGSVSLLPSAAGAAVTIDGQTVAPSALSNPIFLSPGKHVARAVRSGYREAEQTFMIFAGSQLVIELSLVSLAPPAAGPPNGPGLAYPATPVPEDPYGTGGAARQSGPAMPMIQPQAPTAAQPVAPPTAPQAAAPANPRVVWSAASPAPWPATPPATPPERPKVFDELASWDELASKGLLESQKPAPAGNALIGPPGAKARVEAEAKPGKLERHDSNFVLGLKKLSPLSWTGIGLTLVTGITAAACWGTASKNYDVYRDIGTRYTAGEITADDPDLADAKKETLHYGRLASGFGVSALLVAVGTTVSIIFDVRRAKKKERLAAAWISPGGVVVGF
jgi:hypothetical protein